MHPVHPSPDVPGCAFSVEILQVLLFVVRLDQCNTGKMSYNGMDYGGVSTMMRHCACHVHGAQEGATSILAIKEEDTIRRREAGESKVHIFA